MSDIQPTQEYLDLKRKEANRDAALVAYVDEPDTAVAEICTRYGLKPANFAKMVKRFVPMEHHRSRSNAHSDETFKAAMEMLDRGTDAATISAKLEVSRQYVAQLKRGKRAYDYLSKQGT
jgi:hypothetical protein